MVTGESGGVGAPVLEVRGLRHEFARAGGAPLEVLAGVDLTVRAGQFAALIGPSGSGKSTLFNILAGLDRPTAGSVEVDGAAVTGPGRQVGYLPQKDLLFPWRTVEANAALGLEIQGVGRKQARDRVRPLLAEFGLDGFERAYPAQLSGGMRQRAALLRTVAMERPILLLDEPFGALDSLTRTRTQLWLAGMRARHGWTILLVTHDIREAVLLADTVHVLSARPGRITARIEVDLPQPRTAAAFQEPRFAELERRLLAELGMSGADPDDDGGAR
jgi:ABC-type nitrate/sulfonate/bicarbonate transport system ATPase subunit